MMVVDKKSNLARGFADVHTPSAVENELLYSWREKRYELKSRISELQEQMDRSKSIKESNIIRAELNGKKQALEALGRKINKRVDFHMLVIDRLKQEISTERFERACRLAKLDKENIMQAYSIDD